MSDQWDAPEASAPQSEALPQRIFVVILADGQAEGRRGGIASLSASDADELISGGAARRASADDLAIAYPAAIPEV